MGGWSAKEAGSRLEGQACRWQRDLNAGKPVGGIVIEILPRARWASEPFEEDIVLETRKQLEGAKRRR